MCLPNVVRKQHSGVESWETLLDCLGKISYFLPSHGRQIYLGRDRLFLVIFLHMGIVDELSKKGKEVVFEKKYTFTTSTTQHSDTLF